MKNDVFMVGFYSAFRETKTKLLTVNLYEQHERCLKCSKVGLSWRWADETLTHCCNCIPRPVRVTDAQLKIYKFLLPFRIAARIEYYQNLGFWPITAEYREVLIERVEIAEKETKAKKNIQVIKKELTNRQPGQAKMLVG